jgi:UDP-glucose 4-epimerase
VSRVLVTGAGGYIGGRLVGRLAGAGHDVRALVRERAPYLRVPQVVLDLATDDPEALLEACAGAQAVVHLAGENEVVAASQPAAALTATVAATERLAEACVRAGVKRLVYLSTVHVYGERMRPGATLTEGMRPEPRSAYAISRLASEHVAAALARQAFELIVLRLTNAVGAPVDARVDRWSLVANDLSRQGAREGVLRLRSSGVQWRDFVPLSHVCEAIAEAAALDGRLAPGTYNLATGTPRTVRSLAELIQEAFARLEGRRPQLQAPDPEDDPPGPYRVSVQRLSRRGVRLEAPLQEAVQETVRFCLEHREEL